MLNVSQSKPDGINRTKGDAIENRFDTGPLVAETADKTRLLTAAARQMVVLRGVMKLVLQQARKHMSVEDVARLGDAQLFVLHVLDADGQMAAGDLASRCHVADPTMSKTLNHLEANGLIRREIDPTNRRVVKVSLTEEGGAILHHVETELLRSLSQVLSPLTEAQLRDLIVALGHLQNLVGSEEGESAKAPLDTLSPTG